MRSTDPSISSAALSHVLDALEVSCPITRRALAEATGLGLSTVGRALSTCVSHGILTNKMGTDPTVGRACSAYIPAEGLLLPLLTLTRGHSTIRILDTALNPVHTAVTELHPAAPTEEAVRILSRRLVALLRGYSGRDHRHVASPILLADNDLPAEVLRDTVTHALGTAPLAILRHEDTVARALGRMGTPKAADSILFLSVGEHPHACLLLRDGAGEWSPSSLGRGLTHTLTRTLRAADSSAEGVRRATAVLLTDLCRFLSPDLIHVEDPRRILPDNDFFAPLLPDGVGILVGGGDGLTIAEYGAALTGRRMLWDKILIG